MSRQTELTPEKVRVAAGILIDKSGRVLVTDRTRSASMQQFWEFPGGKLSAGESAACALCRELREELGVHALHPEHFQRLEHDYPGFSVSIDFFLVRQWRGDPQGREGQALRWVRASEIDADMLLPADAAVVEVLSKY